MKKLLFYLAILVSFVSCEPEHYSKFSCINGYVRYKDTYEPIPNVQIELDSGSPSTQTNDDGFFEFNDLEVDRQYKVYYLGEADLYKGDIKLATPTVGKCEDASITLSRDDK